MSYITAQAALAKYLADTLHVKQGVPMVKLISYLRTKSKKSGESALQSIITAKAYATAHKEEAKKKYDEFAKMKIVRKKKSTKK